MASRGPLLASAIVNSTGTPSSAVAGSTVLSTARSVCWTVKVAAAALSVKLVSGRFIRVMAALLVMVSPPYPLLTVPVIVSVPAAPTANSPMSQMPVASL